MKSIINSLGALSDKTRLRIVLLLQLCDLSVVELQQILGMGQSRISAHLGKLKQAGLVIDRRVGKSVMYSLNDGHDAEAWEHIEVLLEKVKSELAESPSDALALALVQKKRADKSRDYFNKLAGKFGRSYCPGRTWRGLAHMLLAFFPQAVVADLGAGEGTLSQMLARRARRVIAVDNSEKMVEFGAKLARENGITNLDYLLGDLEEPPIESGSVDIVIFSQALHHAVNPQRALEAAYRILKPGGRLAILDLLSHTFEEAHDLYADVWLGFSEVEMYALLECCNFSDIDVGIVSRDPENPQFQTLLATASKQDTASNSCATGRA